MEKHFDELCAICTQEHGKTLDESKGDVRRGIDNVEVACGMPSLLLSTGGAMEQIATGIDFARRCGNRWACSRSLRPTTFLDGPILVLPYAIASGNTVVVKPKRRCRFSQVRLFELLHEVGLPPGVVNMVNGGRSIVNAVLEHRDIVGVSFVGSSPVAEHVYTRCGATGKRVQALGGAKNFGVVMDDCVWDRSVDNIVDSSMGCAGQRCLALSVVIGVGSAYAELGSRRYSPSCTCRQRRGARRDDGPAHQSPPSRPRARIHRQRRARRSEIGPRRPSLQGRKVPERALSAPTCSRAIRRHGDDHRPRRDFWSGPVPDAGQGHERGAPYRESAPAGQRFEHLYLQRGTRPALVQGCRGFDGGGQRFIGVCCLDGLFPVQAPKAPSSVT